MKRPEYKPLLFTTTVRNPQRMKALLSVFFQYNGRILTDQLATEIVCELIRFGLYRPTIKTETIKQKWNSTGLGEFSDVLLTAEEIAYIVEHNPQNHKEAGFERGFPSRFATFFDFAKELGFVYYEPGKPIEFSEIGERLASIITINVEGEIILIEEQHPEYEQQAFLQAMSKSQRSNPFVRVLNDNIPLILLLQVIQKLNADPEYNNVGISRKELPLLIFWKDNNANALYLRIKQLRQEYGFSPSDEVIIDICTEEIMGGFKKFKPKSIVSEYPDEFIRKMRLTGLISLRGGGRFIDINHNEDEKATYVLDRYSHYDKYTTEKEYFDYMAEIDPNLFSIIPKEVNTEHTEELLDRWVAKYTWDTIKIELGILSKKSTSKDEVLRFIPAPARLEFLAALAIKARLPDVRVVPNYPCDDEGLPTSTAGGDQGDIVCYENRNGILIEVTMAQGRTQTMMEVWPIERHLAQLKREIDTSIGYFIAPSIFADSLRQIEYVRHTSNLHIKPLSILEFVRFMESTDTLSYNY